MYTLTPNHKTWRSKSIHLYIVKVVTSLKTDCYKYEMYYVTLMVTINKNLQLIYKMSIRRIQIIPLYKTIKLQRKTIKKEEIKKVCPKQQEKELENFNGKFLLSVVTFRRSQNKMAEQKAPQIFPFHKDTKLATIYTGKQTNKNKKPPS